MLNIYLLASPNMNLNGIIYLILGIMLGPPLLLVLIGLSLKKGQPKAAKIFYILAGIYLVIGLGICGSLMI